MHAPKTNFAQSVASFSVGPSSSDGEELFTQQLGLMPGRSRNRLRRMDASKKQEYQDLLLSLVPPSGESIGNVTLREQLQKKVEVLGDQLSYEDYFALRDPLIDSGLLEQGRGRGGSVHRAKASEAPSPSPDITPAQLTDDAAAAIAKVSEAAAQVTETTLYLPFHAAIVKGYTKDNRLKRFISEITAHQGRRATGGKWTRPDITLAAVRTYKFTQGKRLEVITFEVKPNLDAALEGVYEALAHSAFAHRSYLAVDIRDYKDIGDVPDDRIVQECTRHGVGYITFTDVGDYDTYDVVCPAKLKDPDPEEVDNFVKKQISSEKQDELLDLF